MQQTRISTNDLAPEHQPLAEFISATRDMVVQHSHELHHNEISDFIDHGNIKPVLLKLWEFTGHYPLWPEALLGRTDLNGSLRETLQLHLNQQTGLTQPPARTALFQSMAKSLGVSLPEPAPQGWLISSVVLSAKNRPLPEALGKYFADQCLSEWAELATSIADVPEVDMAFFNQKPHSINILNELPQNQNRGAFTEAAQAYAIQRTIFMNQIRALI